MEDRMKSLNRGHAEAMAKHPRLSDRLDDGVSRSGAVGALRKILAAASGKRSTQKEAEQVIALMFERCQLERELPMVREVVRKAKAAMGV